MSRIVDLWKRVEGYWSTFCGWIGSHPKTVAIIIAVWAVWSLGLLGKVIGK